MRDKSGEGMVIRSIALLALFCVVKPELCDLKILCSNSVNYTMLICDTARPEPSKGVLQRFRFPDPMHMRKRLCQGPWFSGNSAKVSYGSLDLASGSTTWKGEGAEVGEAASVTEPAKLSLTF